MTHPYCFKGATPENWLCVDCGVNTAPGFSTRLQMEATFALGTDSIRQAITSDSEVYTVTEKVWRKARMKPWGGCLCVGCLEDRLGRRLRPKDFDVHVFNSPALPCTGRLRSRRHPDFDVAGYASRSFQCTLDGLEEARGMG